MATSGIATIGMKFGYGTGATAPASVTELTRINNLPSLSVSLESIDASAIVDGTTKRIAGRSDVSETYSVTVNVTPETMTEWETLITTYQGLADGAFMWFELYHPDLDEGWWFKGEPPTVLPIPEVGQNSLLTMEIPLVVNEYVGRATAVEPTA